MIRVVTAAAMISAALFVAGCSWGGKDNAEAEDYNGTEQTMYRQSQRALRSGNYTSAIELLQRLEARFPFGRYAEQAQLEIIYAQYMSGSYDAARSSADRFARLHPQNGNIDYAMYLKGLSSYHKNRGMMDRIFASDASKRDMSAAAEAYEEFAQLLVRFPNSQYAPDTRQRMLYLKNLLANAELHVADYYMRRGAYVAASNRARHVVETYPRSMATEDALAVLIEANYRLGLEEAANDALRVLALNFPEYNAFGDDGALMLAKQVRNRDRSWTNLISFGVLDRPDVPPPIRLRKPEEAVAGTTDAAPSGTD